MLKLVHNADAVKPERRLHPEEEKREVFTNEVHGKASNLEDVAEEQGQE